jgi:electron transport complex protein RnfA
LLYRFILVPFDLTYLQTIVFILVIAALVQFVEMFLRKAVPSLYQALGVYLPLITTNCAVLGVCINNIDLGYNYPQALVNALGAGIGFLLAMVIFSGMRSRLENNTKIPAPFQGVPITMTTAALLSLAFMGFGGLV